jgi:hypothetical protein
MRETMVEMLIAGEREVTRSGEEIEVIDDGIRIPLEKGLERELLSGLFRCSDAQRGLTAFVEKREPTLGQP